MDRLTSHQKHAIRLGLVGLVIIVLSLKVMLQWSERRSPLPTDGQPVILFFTLDEPCECMQELVEQAEIQVGQWPEAQRSSIRLHRIDFDTRQDLAGKYSIVRVPCLVLLNTVEEPVYWQDVWQLEGDPFDLKAFEAQIRSLQH